MEMVVSLHFRGSASNAHETGIVIPGANLDVSFLAPTYNRHPQLLPISVIPGPDRESQFINIGNSNS